MRCFSLITLITATLAAAILVTPAAAQNEGVRSDETLPAYCYDPGVTEAQAARLQEMKGKSLPADLLSSLEWRTGDPKNLGASRGKVVVLQFWSLGSPSKRSWLQR